MNKCKFYGRFLLCGSKEENEILKAAVDYFPGSGFRRGRYYRKIAIYTTTSRYGIVVDSKIRKRCKIILLQSDIFPKVCDPSDRLFRFLVFTILHECAHITGVTDEAEADNQAYKWHNEYIAKHGIKSCNFDSKERLSTEDFLSGRDWIYISTKDNINDYISGRIGFKLVEEFINKCEIEGRGITTVLKELVKNYIDV